MCMLVLPLSAIGKTQTETFFLDFSESDFSCTLNNNGELEIISQKDFSYPEANEPALPLISKDIAIDGRFSYKSVVVKYEKRELMTGVRLAQSPMPSTTDVLPSESTSVTTMSYDVNQQYPASNCIYVSTSNWDNIRVLHFMTSPFIYESATQKIYFIDSMKLDIELDDQYPLTYRSIDKIGTSILKNMVINKENIDALKAEHIQTHSLELEDRIDYVVITNQELASSFQPLCQWKTEKGLYAKLITIEDIQTTYGGKDLQLKIKNCLYDLYNNHGLKYALLGGDDLIVPVRGCYGTVTTDKGRREDSTIPTDMYYACFDGCFDWDENQNGIYGEVADNINLKQSIYVTRVPICKATHVQSFIEKLLAYEKNPIYNHNFLMCGVNSFNTGTEDQSDSEMQGNNLYSKYIMPNWDGVRYKFYDTSTDFEGNNSYDVTAKNLNEQLEKGYAFMNIITHGTQTLWHTESGNHYDITFGNKQQNSAYTIITTSSCLTNAFDYSTQGGTVDPCLSESLIRNPQSGVIAYLGCSRQGYGYGSDKLGTSLTYEGEFYKKLFSKTIDNMSFGVLVAAVKSSKISNCYNNGSWRWVQFGLNPIGDPEMPIWISKPKQFNYLNISTDGEYVSITPSEEQCRICVVDEWDHGEGYFNVFEDADEVVIADLPEESSICVTKPGYLPKQIKMNILQNKSISGNRKYTNDVILCGSSITTSLKQGEFVIKEGKTTLTADIVVLGPGTKVESGAQLVINQ